MAEQGGFFFNISSFLVLVMYFPTLNFGNQEIYAGHEVMNFPFRLGVVDIGTMALRFDIYEIQANRSWALIANHRTLPRLGELLEHPEDFYACLEGELREVMHRAEILGVQQLLLVGTMVFRRLPGAENYLKRAKEKFGISLRVVSGEEEAQLTTRGILSQEPHLPRSLVLIDIGGGSTEVIFVVDRKIQKALSFDAGCLRSADLDWQQSTSTQYQDYFSAARASIDLYQPTFALGSSGTARGIEKILAHGKRKKEAFSFQQLQTLWKKIEPLSSEQLLQVPGVEKNRADILRPGARIFLELLAYCRISKFRVTHFSLRHGVLDEWISTQMAR